MALDLLPHQTAALSSNARTQLEIEVEHVRLAHATTTRSFDAFRGDLARLSGRTTQAEAYFVGARQWCEREGLQIEAARTMVGIAALASAAGDADYADSRRVAAEAIFRRQGAIWDLEQVLRLRLEQQLGSDDAIRSIEIVASAVAAEVPDLASRTSPDGTVTILFSDIEGSTELVRSLGDGPWMELLRWHNGVVRDHSTRHDGYEVKSMGDGFMIAFQSCRSGLSAAREIQRAISLERPPGIPPFRIRIGLHAGEVVKEADDFFGRHVNLAARVASAAEGGEILVTETVRELLAGESPTLFLEPVEKVLKGFDGRVKMFPVTWRSSEKQPAQSEGSGVGQEELYIELPWWRPRNLKEVGIAFSVLAVIGTLIGLSVGGVGK
jgi:class 3 adenylate cyclase